jgi:VanZ family protein
LGDGFLYFGMKMIVAQLRKWLPSILLMGVIFWFSSQPSSTMPNFDWADKVLKKGGHILGYALLAWSYWYALDFQPNKRWLVWLLSIVYAVTDEYHQSFVTGRYPSAYDVLVFDNLGALIVLWITGNSIKQKRPGQLTPDHFSS